MQQLKMSSNRSLEIKSGLRKVTFRLGARNISLGKLNILDAENESDSIVVEVSSVSVKKFDEIDTDDVKGISVPGFRLSELIKTMHQIYPQIKPDSEVTIVEFSIP
jgi:hypothetical protein